MFTVLQDIAAVLLRVTKEVLSGYAKMITLSLIYFVLMFPYIAKYVD